MGLFRDQVIKAKAPKIYGDIIIYKPRKYWIYILILSSLFTTSALWAIFFQLPHSATVVGMLTTVEPIAKIYPPKNGMFRSVNIHEGQKVKEGQIIAEIDTDQSAMRGITYGEMADKSTEIQEKINIQQISSVSMNEKSKNSGLKRNINFLQAERDGILSQIEIQHDFVESNKSMLENIQAVFDKRLVTRDNYETKKYNYLKSKQELENLKAQLSKTEREISDTQSELSSEALLAEQQRSDLEIARQSAIQRKLSIDSGRRYYIRAPITGVATAIQMIPGSSVDIKYPIAVIVPNQVTLQAELLVPSRAIGKVRPGQRAAIRYDAFPYQRFGQSMATVASVSQVIVSPNELAGPLKVSEPVYRVILEIPQWLSAQSGKVRLQSGMTLTASVTLETQSFFSWLTEPQSRLGSAK